MCNPDEDVRAKVAQSSIGPFQINFLEVSSGKLKILFVHLRLTPALVKDISLVIWQKGESQTGVSRKQSTPNFPKNDFILPYQGIRNVRFSENFEYFVFLKNLF